MDTSTAAGSILHCALELARTPGSWGSSFLTGHSRAYIRSKVGIRKI